MTNVDKFKKITANMAVIFEEKNKNYGNSFDKTLDEDGLLVAKIRLSDKLNRFSSLIKLDSSGTIDENICDTLLDLANYAIMTVMWMDKDTERNGVTTLKNDRFLSMSSSHNDVKYKIGFDKY